MESPTNQAYYQGMIGRRDRAIDDLRSKSEALRGELNADRKSAIQEARRSGRRGVIDFSNDPVNNRVFKAEGEVARSGSAFGYFDAATGNRNDKKAEAIDKFTKDLDKHVYERKNILAKKYGKDISESNKLYEASLKGGNSVNGRTFIGTEHANYGKMVDARIEREAAEQLKAEKAAAEATAKSGTGSVVATTPPPPPQPKAEPKPKPKPKVEPKPSNPGAPKGGKPKLPAPPAPPEIIPPAGGGSASSAAKKGAEAGKEVTGRNKKLLLAGGALALAGAGLAAYRYDQRHRRSN